MQTTQNNFHQKLNFFGGSTSIMMKDIGSEKEGNTNATIGMGNITVGGEENPELAGLNRDLDKSQEVTKDMITGALDGSVTIDNRLFTPEGRANIAKQHKQVGEAVEKSWDALKDVFEHLTKKDVMDSKVASMQKASEDAAKDKTIKPIKPETVVDKATAIQYLEKVLSYEDATEEVKAGVQYIIENYSLSQDFILYKSNSAASVFNDALKDTDMMKAVDAYETLSTEGKQELVTKLVAQTTRTLGLSSIEPQFESMGPDYFGEYRWDENGNEYLVINVDYLDDFWQTMDTIGHEVMGHKMTKNIVESGVKPDGMSDVVWQDMKLSYTNMVNSYVKTDPYYEQQQSEVDAQKSGLYFKVKFEVNRVNNRKALGND